MDNNFLFAEAQEENGNNREGKLADRFQRLLDCFGGTGRTRQSGAFNKDELQDGGGGYWNPGGTMQEDIISFVCKTLLTKMVQFFIICGYFFFVDNLPQAFERATVSWTLIPLTIFSATFLLVRLKKNPPHYAVVLILILTTSFCFGYLVGIAFTRFRFHVVSLPLSILFVYATYFLLIPLFFCQLISLDMTKRKYHLIPLWIVWIQNAILVLVTSFLPVQPSYYGMVNKFDMLCLFCLPTIFCSTLFIWFSMLQLRQIVEGQWFRIMFDSFFHDYLYAALYMV